MCEAAEWMLGGIDVDYYYAVTMESVKQIVDIVGGVWYNLEGDFDNGGRYYVGEYVLGKFGLTFRRFLMEKAAEEEAMEIFNYYNSHE